MSARSAARAALSLVALAIALALGAVLGVAASPSTADAVQAPASAVVVESALDDDPFLVALLGEATGLPANADELSLAADRVCEGFAAGVPLVSMTDRIAVEFGVDDEESRRFVNLAGVTRCRTA